MPKSIYIVFLRGVMPSGKNRVPMAELRRILIEDGFENVRTWIQSGNVVLKTELSPDKLAIRIHELIKTKIGAELGIIIKSREELVSVLDENPFREGYDISRVFFSLHNDFPDDELMQKLVSIDFSPEKLILTPQTAYMFIPGTYGRGKLSNNFLEKKLKITATMRNFNTISKMIELSEE